MAVPISFALEQVLIDMRNKQTTEDGRKRAQDIIDMLIAQRQQATLQSLRGAA